MIVELVSVAPVICLAKVFIISMALKSDLFISTNQNMSSEHFNENQPYLIQNSHSRIIIDFVFLIEQQTKAEMIRIIVYTMYNICTTQYTTHNVLHMIVLKI